MLQTTQTLYFLNIVKWQIQPSQINQVVKANNIFYLIIIQTKFG